MTTRGKLSPELAAVLRNKDARNRLRHAMRTGEELTVRIGDTTYRISTLKSQRVGGGSVQSPKLVDNSPVKA